MLIAWAIISNSVSGQVLPDFSQATFVPGAPIDNPYFPLLPGTVFVYQGENADQETERIETVVTFDTKEILGVSATVIRDRAWLDNVLVEDTFDWYAQDTVGNVWYLGEFTTAFEYDTFGNLIGTNHDGSWEAGVDGALPGWRMEASPQVGDSYYQEFAPGIAEDEGEVLSLTETVSGPLGDFQDVLKILDSTALAPDLLEHKLYAPGIGLVLVEEELDELGVPAFTLDLVRIAELDEDDIDDLDEDQDEDTDDESDDDGDDEGDCDHDRKKEWHGSAQHDSDDEADDDGEDDGDEDDGDEDDGDEDDGADEDDAGEDEDADDDDNGGSGVEQLARTLSGSHGSIVSEWSAAKSSPSISSEIMRLLDDGQSDGVVESPIIAQLMAAESDDLSSADALVAVSGSGVSLGLGVAAVPEPCSLLLAGLAASFLMRRGGYRRGERIASAYRLTSDATATATSAPSSGPTTGIQA